MVNHSPGPAPASRFKRATLSLHHHHTPFILKHYPRAISVKLRTESGMATKQVTVVGSINVDLVFTLQRLPAPGETVSASSLERFPGGKGANQAAAAGKLGCPTVMVGQVGTDDGGRFMLAALADAAVATDSTVATVAGDATGTAAVLLQPNGENSIVIVGGANTAPWACTPPQKEAVASAGMLLLQRELPDDVNLKFAEMARDLGVPVVMDAGGAEGPLDAKLLRCVTLLSPNETELARMVGMATGTREEVLAAASALSHQAGNADVLIKLGAKGSLLVTGNGVFEQAAAPVRNIVDTTGAGDCFTAAFVVARLEGAHFRQALKFATAAAGLCIQVKGAMTSLPRRADVDAFVDTF